MISRYQIMRAHMLLAGFLLPIAIIYFVSGALYTLDIKGHVEKQTIRLRLKQPFTPDLDRLTRLTKKTLLERKLPQPDGEPALRKKRGVYELRWDDLAHVVTLVPGHDARTVTLTVRKRSLLTQIMRIHRAEAGTMFKILAVILALGLVVMFATGVQMAQAIPRLRRPVLLAIAGGLVTFLTLLLI